MSMFRMMYERRIAIMALALGVLATTGGLWAEGDNLPNNGLVLTLEGKGFVNFISSEIGDYPYRPTLVVAFTRR